MNFIYLPICRAGTNRSENIIFIGLYNTYCIYHNGTCCCFKCFGKRYCIFHRNGCFLVHLWSTFLVIRNGKISGCQLDSIHYNHRNECNLFDHRRCTFDISHNENNFFLLLYLNICCISCNGIYPLNFDKKCCMHHNSILKVLLSSFNIIFGGFKYINTFYIKS